MKLSLFPLPIVLLNRTGASIPARAAGFKTAFANGVAWHFLTQAGRLNRKLERFRIDWTTAENPKPQNRSGPPRRPSESSEAGKFASRSSPENRSGRKLKPIRHRLKIHQFRRGVHTAPLPACFAVAE
jgi:hypothetical protein